MTTQLTALSLTHIETYRHLMTSRLTSLSHIDRNIHASYDYSINRALSLSHTYIETYRHLITTQLTSLSDIDRNIQASYNYSINLSLTHR